MRDVGQPTDWWWHLRDPMGAAPRPLKVWGGVPRVGCDHTCLWKALQEGKEEVLQEHLAAIYCFPSHLSSFSGRVAVVTQGLGYGAFWLPLFPLHAVLGTENKIPGFSLLHTRTSLLCVLIAPLPQGLSIPVTLTHSTQLVRTISRSQDNLSAALRPLYLHLWRAARAGFGSNGTSSRKPLLLAGSYSSPPNLGHAASSGLHCPLHYMKSAHFLSWNISEISGYSRLIPQWVLIPIAEPGCQTELGSKVLC